MSLKSRLATLLTLLVLPVLTVNKAQAQFYPKPAYQADIDWASNDTGAPDCPELYLGLLSPCLGEGLIFANNAGNRSCVISIAQAWANNGQDWAAFGMVLVTQCHNPTEYNNLLVAGPLLVGRYLREGY